jgi:hypothetical protein
MTVSRGLRNVISLVDARLQRLRALGANSLTPTERIALPELAHERPRLNELREAHRARLYLSGGPANIDALVAFRPLHGSKGLPPRVSGDICSTYDPVR